MLNREARHVLLRAQNVISRDHTSVQLAVDRHGRKCSPLSEYAVSWSSVGALIRVAPSRAPGGPQHTWAAWRAYLALQDAAEANGHLSTAAVDRAGLAEVNRMFTRALNTEPEPRRRRPPPQVGSHPRGDDPVV